MVGGGRQSTSIFNSTEAPQGFVLGLQTASWPIITVCLWVPWPLYFLFLYLKCVCCWTWATRRGWLVACLVETAEGASAAQWWSFTQRRQPWFSTAQVILKSILEHLFPVTEILKFGIFITARVVLESVFFFFNKQKNEQQSIKVEKFELKSERSVIRAATQWKIVVNITFFSVTKSSWATVIQYAHRHAINGVSVVYGLQWVLRSAYFFRHALLSPPPPQVFNHSITD